ncbi:MAG: TonB-dependent receptor [Ignavibacteriales bacterium]|nr:TonB-dependent receptor [Ignavibacteriales bacterium]
MIFSGIIKKNNISLLIFLFVLTHSNIFSQSGALKGKVFDGSTKEALFGANLIIKGTNIGSATDMEGNYIIRNVPSGSQTLEISYIGYNPKTVKINIVENKTIDLNIILDYKVIEGEIVVVTGQVEGQIQAINQQLSSNTISNVVSKSRIEELPDVNAAESIGRLPGVSISRSGGEANKVSIRGLSPKYNTVTVNGVRLPSNSGEDRSVDLSLISSNMLAGIEVKKANTADMDADALGGTIDLRLKEAPSNFKSNLNAQGGYNKMLNDWGNYNINGNISNRFFEDQLGVIIGFNADQYNRSADQYSGSYTRRDSPEGITENIISNVITRDVNTIRDRLGASVVLDYRIPNGRLSINGFFNQLSWDQLRREQTYNLTDNRHYISFRDNGGKTSIFTAAFGSEQDFDWVKYDVGLSLSGSKTTAPNEREFSFVREGGSFVGAITVDTYPTEISKLATNDSTRIGIQDVYRYDTDRNENQSTIQFNIQIPINISNDVNGYFKTGAKFRWLDRLNDQEQFGRNGLYYGNGNGPNNFLSVLGERIPAWDVEGLVDQYGVLPISHFLSNYSRDNFLDKKFPLGFQADFKMLNRMYDALNMVTDSSGSQLDIITIGSLADDYEGVEHYQAAYAMAEFNFGNLFTFIPGVRFENDYSKYTAYVFREVTINNTPAPPADLDTITSIRQNDYFLPMIHLISTPYDWLKIRLAYTQTLTRPDFNMYAPVTRINSYNNYMRAANTKLRPSVSTNYDLSVSVYENHIGLLTLSGFYKSIKDLIFQYNYPINADIPLLEGFRIPSNWTKNVQYGADTYINNENPAYYNGLEIDWQTNLWFVPYLEGVVLNINYTRIFSEMDKQRFTLVQSDRRKPGGGPPRYYMDLADTVRTSRLPDQPSHIANITLGYDYKGFSARLSFLYQTDKVAYIDLKKELDQFTGEYSRWDLTLQQSILENLQLFCNFTNLNERPDESFRGRTLSNPTYIEYYGLTIDFGVRIKL